MEKIISNKMSTKDVFGLMEDTDGNAWTEMRAKIFAKKIRWSENNDLMDAALYPYKSVVDGQHWALRVNDFPAEPLYTLFIDGKPIITVDGLPDGWER